MSTDKGCPRIESNSLTEMMLDLWFVIALPMIAVGVCLLIFGGRNPTTALAMITTALIGTIWLYTIFYLLPTTITPSWSVWLIMYFAYGNGAVLGFGAVLNPKLGVTVCGAAFGFLVGLVVDLVIIRRFFEDSKASTWVIIGFMLLFAVLSVPMHDYAVIISSSIFGSYLAWRVSQRSL